MMSCVSSRRNVRCVFLLLLLLFLAPALFYGPLSDWLALLTRRLYGPTSDWLPLVTSTQQQQPEPAQVTVLIWHWPFGEPFNLAACGVLYNVSGCHLTVDRSLYSQADLVLIHHREISNASALARLPRPPSQKWVWMNFESPSNSVRIPGLENLFNLTLNYRSDADINLPYGSIISTAERVESIPSKDKLVCWIVSYGKPRQKRVRYYEVLRKYVRVHTYGALFHRPVPESDYGTIVSSCKFYLSFENSIHKDYITEKPYRALKFGSVPVVLGPTRRAYEKFLPGDAFIHVDDVASPRALAQLLLRLDRDAEGYRGFFRWQRSGSVRLTTFPQQNACVSCDYVRRHREPRTRKELYKWFWEDEDAVTTNTSMVTTEMGES